MRSNTGRTATRSSGSGLRTAANIQGQTIPILRLRNCKICTKPCRKIEKILDRFSGYKNAYPGVSNQRAWVAAENFIFYKITKFSRFWWQNSRFPDFKISNKNQHPPGYLLSYIKILRNFLQYQHQIIKHINYIPAKQTHKIGYDFFCLNIKTAIILKGIDVAQFMAKHTVKHISA